MFVALGLLAGCDMSKALDAAGDAYKSLTLSDAELEQLGRESAAQMDSKAKIAKGNKYSSRLDKMTRNLKNTDGLKLNFKVYMANDVNAFALPDGSIRVYSGLMDLMTDDEVLFVIGHEIGHVKEGHSKDRFKMVYATSAARKSAEASGNATAGAISRSEMADLGEAFVHAQFSQKQEYASDGHGLALLQKFKKNPNSAVSALRKLASLGSSGGMMSSHPDSNDRADRLEKQIKEGK